MMHGDKDIGSFLSVIATDSAIAVAILCPGIMILK